MNWYLRTSWLDPQDKGEERQSQRILDIEPECTIGWFTEKSDVGQLRSPRSMVSRGVAGS